MAYNQDQVTVHGRTFVKYIDSEDIAAKVQSMAMSISEDYHNDWPIFVVLLNGAYVFAADLLRHMPDGLQTLFVKLSSYHEMQSTGRVEFEEYKLASLKGKKILLIEDIIDTGTTMYALLQYLENIEVQEVKICSLLCKPSKMEHAIPIDYLGYKIDDAFVIGYGLDYDERGRNLAHIYHLAE